LVLMLAVPVAHAQEVKLPTWAQPADHHGVERGKGALLITLGTISLTMGIALAGISGIVWAGYNSDCQYGCDKNDRLLGAGLTHAIFTAAFVFGGAAMMGIGAQKYTTHKVPRVLLAPTVLSTGAGASISGGF
jgi:hypothetical protein